MGAFKLGKMTFGSLFKKPETVLYPLEKKPQPAGLKGHIVVAAERCILCGMCQRSCSTNCITVDRNERFWQIQPYQCIQCGYCVTVCPKKCLEMNPDYTQAATQKLPTRVPIPEQPKPEKIAADKAEPAGEKPDAKLEPAANKAGEAPAATNDPQLESLLGLMTPDKAELVKMALKG